MADNKKTKQTAPGQKFDGDKERFDLLPVKPLMKLVELFTKGAKKYGVRNWEKGIEFGRLFAAMMRHAWKWWGGEKYDPIDGQHHLDAVVWNAMSLRELEETHPELDDRQPQNVRFKDSENDYKDDSFNVPTNVL